MSEIGGGSGRDESSITKLFLAAHYYVSERCQDGWLRGMNSARKAGVFPGNHVVPLKDMPVSPGVMVSRCISIFHVRK